ncbi:MAG: oligosaccharide flippase family protein [Pseudomonadota bacterium]
MTASHYSLSNVRKAIFHFVVGRGASAVAGVASVVLLARNMETADYAGYIAITSLVMLLAMMSTLGLERASARFVPEARMHRAAWELQAFVWKLASLRLVIVLVFASGLILLWPWVARLFSHAIMLPAIPWSVPLFLVANTMFGFFSNTLQSLLEQKILTRLILVQTGSRLALIVFFLAAHDRITLDQSLWVMAIPELVSAVATASVTLVLLRKNSIPIEQVNGQWPDWREVWHIAVHSYGFNMLAMLPQGSFMRTLIAATFPAHVTAAFGFFSTLIDRVRAYLPMQFMYNLIEPVMVASYLQNPDPNALARRSHVIYKANVVLLLSALILVAIAGEAMVDVLTSGKYGEEYWMLSLLLVQVTIGSHVLALQLFFNTLKATQLLSMSGLGALAVMAAGVWLSYLDPSRYWLLACPILYEVAMNAIALYLAKKKGIAYAFPMENYLKLGLLCLGLILAPRLLLGWMTTNLQIQVLMGMAAVGLFFVLSFKLRAITQNEIAMVKRLAGRK